MSAYTTYLECTVEKSSLCADSPSVWSALASSGKGSGPGGGGGVSYNLNQDTDILDSATGVEWIAGQKQLVSGQVVNIRVQLQSEGGDVRNYIAAGKSTVETDFYVRVDSGAWVFLYGSIPRLLTWALERTPKRFPTRFHRGFRKSASV